MLYDQITSQDGIAWKISPAETDDTITARGVVPPGSTWFDGHFPEDPILPGVAQLAMVVDVLKKTLDRAVTVTRLSRIRFKSAIHPGDEVTVEIKTKTGIPLTYTFQLFCDSEPLSSGLLAISGEKRG
jgi:3-hydroxyacyl-[acyl-carrier-protein] dehydratase